MAVPQTKLMGGGSSINGGTALRSRTNDSREWVELGNDKWDFESVYKVYQELERDEVRGTKGRHPIFRLPDEKLGKIQKAFIQGAKEQGHKEVMDLNAPDAEGVGPSTVCRAGDKRFSLANTFIDPIRSSRKNLTILDNTLVEKIVFENERVAGVQTSDDVIRASREVILSARAILSPAILQRSRIGPSSLLKKHGIQEISNLPVGSNAYDHPCIPIVAKPRPGANKKDDYFLQSQARFSSSFQPGAVDHQLVYFSFLFAEKPDPRVQQRSLAGTTSGHVAGIGYNLNKPTSCGAIFIRSSDAKDLPVVDPQSLTS